MESDKKNEIVSAGEEATEVTVSPQQPVSTWRPQDADREVIKANIRRRVWTSNASPKAQFIPAKPLPTVQDDGRKTVAVYARVSTKSTEQVSSIENQTRYYTEKVEKTPNWEMLEIYSDDGHTGTDANRENFQRLLSDVMSGKINCVVVKDLSRFARNYSDAGSLIDNLFVQMGVRFISLAENVDSYLNPDSVSSIIVPITNVMNDQYCYQTSKKIRQVFDMKRRNGEFIGSYAPYGYVKDPGDKHALLVDPEAAEVVKSIFSMFLSGMNKRGITYYLNDHGVLCPTAYKKQQGLKYNAPNAQSNPMWSTITIDTILKNRVYVGDMVQGRQRVKSYKIHIQERVPEEEWFIVENTHEAIIDRETFDKVQGLLKRDTRTAPKAKQLYLFSGFLKCADCGRAMSRIASKGMYVYYQ